MFGSVGHPDQHDPSTQARSSERWLPQRRGAALEDWTRVDLPYRHGRSLHDGAAMAGKVQPGSRSAGIAMFVVGAVLGLTAGPLLFVDVVESGWAIVGVSPPVPGYGAC